MFANNSRSRRNDATKLRLMLAKSVISFDSYSVETEYQYLRTMARRAFKSATNMALHILPETIGEKPYFWAVYTRNRYWISKTILACQESGLQNQWNTWVHRMMARTQISAQKSVYSEFVSFWSFAVMVWLLLGILALSAFIIFAELVIFSISGNRFV